MAMLSGVKRPKITSGSEGISDCVSTELEKNGGSFVERTQDTQRGLEQPGNMTKAKQEKTDITVYTTRCGAENALVVRPLRQQEHCHSKMVFRSYLCDEKNRDVSYTDTD